MHRSRCTAAPRTAAPAAGPPDPGPADRPTAPATTATLLEAVVDALELSVLDGDHRPPLLVALRRPRSPDGAPGDPELLVRPLPPSTHPADVLDGLEAPADWDVVGCLAEGTARRLDGGQAEPCTATFLLHRDGTSVLSGAGLPRRVGDESTEPAVGLVPDVCRRVLGMPTPPPDPGQTVGGWAAARWLDGLFAAVVADPVSPWTWARIVAEHPPAMVDRYRTATWGRLRLELRAGTGPAVGIDPARAEWVDDGMLARDLTVGLPPVAQLLDDLVGLLAPEVHARVQAQVGGAG